MEKMGENGEKFVKLVEPKYYNSLSAAGAQAAVCSNFGGRLSQDVNSHSINLIVDLFIYYMETTLWCYLHLWWVYSCNPGHLCAWHLWSISLNLAPWERLARTLYLSCLIRSSFEISFTYSRLSWHRLNNVRALEPTKEYWQGCLCYFDTENCQ